MYYIGKYAVVVCMVYGYIPLNTHSYSMSKHVYMNSPLDNDDRGIYTTIQVELYTNMKH